MYEELVYLDELYGCLDPQLSPYETARVEARRKDLKKKILEIEGVTAS